MNTLVSASGLVFFKAERYMYLQHHVFDTSSCPRPHFCMGLITEGNGTFKNCATGERIHVAPGDIIFVPITSRYVSTWDGDPRVSYISMHFIFNAPGIFSRQRNFELQKITPADFEGTLITFEYVLEHYKTSDEATQLEVLSRFYGLLSRLLPRLETRDEAPVDARLLRAVDYIEENYTENIAVEQLAAACQMSVSRFFPCFKKAMGVTPVDYINHVRVRMAIIALMHSEDFSIESISEKAGFESAAYFRRVFKRITGKTPREYRKTAMEI